MCYICKTQKTQTTAMDKGLELENKFIQLWNDGKSYDEIVVLTLLKNYK